MKNLTLAALGLIALAALPASAANWSDVYLGYQYSSMFRDPGTVGKEVKNRIELSGVAGWDYGTNFFDVNMLAGSHRDPANTTDGQDHPGVPGDNPYGPWQALNNQQVNALMFAAEFHF